MLIIGRVLIAIGLLLFAQALLMPVAVPDPGGMGPIANNDLMNQRLLFAVVGGAAFVGGWLALILRALKKG